jgi:hypothetical protein
VPSGTTAIEFQCAASSVSSGVDLAGLTCPCSIEIAIIMISTPPPTWKAQMVMLKKSSSRSPNNRLVIKAMNTVSEAIHATRRLVCGDGLPAIDR